MKHTALFRFLAMMIILFYGAALAQAGQVITQDERSWANKAVEGEKALATVPDSNTIAVLYYANKTGKTKLTPLEKGVAVMLITDLAKVDQIQVVERIRLQALLDEIGLGETGLVDAETAPRVGKMLGAYYVNSGDIMEGKIKELEIDSSILDVPFKSVTKQPSSTGEMNELFKLEKEILFNIIDQMNIYISPAKKAELEKPLSASTAALLALFLGIGHSDKGEYVEAAKMYEQALIEDSNLEMAKSALQELKGMGLVSTEEIAAVEESPSSAPGTESGGSSVGTVVGVGLALAVVGGAAAFALSSSSDDDGSNVETTQLSNDGSTPPADTTDTTPPNVSVVDGKQVIRCEGDTVMFQFDEAMNTSSFRVDISEETGWTVSSEWSSVSRLNVVLTGPYDPIEGTCNGVSFLTITLNDFRDVAGNELGSRSFTFSVQ